MSKDLGLPSTPANLIRNPSGSISGLNNLNHQIKNAQPRKTNNIISRGSIYNQLKSPLSPRLNSSPEILGFVPITPENDEEIEMAINRLLMLIDNNQPIENTQLKQMLQKCLITMSHYKLQNQILKFNSNETLKRSEIENELIQKQVDQLSCFLKSPFKPKEEQGKIFDEDFYTIKKSIPKASSLTFNKKLKLTKVTKPTKLKLKLVEKHPNVSNTANISVTNNDNIKNNSEFNQCIKVFHLEKN